MTTYLQNQNVRRAFSAFFLLALLVSMFSGTVGRLDLGMVSVASACQADKPCADSNGTPTITEPKKKDDVVTVTIDDVQAEVVSLTNNGGGTPNLNAQGVQTQALTGSNDSTMTLSVPEGTTLNLPANTNTTVIYYVSDSDVTIVDAASIANTSSGLPVGTNNLAGVGNVDNNGNHNGSNPHVYTVEELTAFAETLGFDCGENATNANVSCWNYWYITNLHRENGQPVCGSTGNANNPLIKDYGGWLIKLSMIKSRVDDGKYEYGETYTCGGNSKNNRR